MVAVFIGIDSRTNSILRRPDIITQGFIYPDEKSLKMIDNGKELLYSELIETMKNKITFGEIKNICRSVIGQHFYNHTHRNPKTIIASLSLIVFLTE